MKNNIYHYILSVKINRKIKKHVVSWVKKVGVVTMLEVTNELPHKVTDVQTRKRIGDQVSFLKPTDDVYIVDVIDKVKLGQTIE